MADLLALLTAAKLPEKIERVCTRGDLVAEFERLEGELKLARAKDENSFSGGESRAVVEKMDAIREQMQAASVNVRLRAMDKMRPIGLVAEHPPREDEVADKTLGYNQETYYTALVRESIVSFEHDDGTTLAASELNEEAWTALLSGLSYRQFDNLVGAALLLNNRDVDVPFSHVASLISRTSDDDSK